MPRENFIFLHELESFETDQNDDINRENFSQTIYLRSRVNFRHCVALQKMTQREPQQLLDKLWQRN